MWYRDRGLGLETISRPKKCGLGLGLECTGLGLGLERCGLGLGLKGMILVLGIWSRSFAFGLGLAPLVWPLVGTRVEYLLNVGHICGYSGISEVTSNSCDDPPRTKGELEDLVVRFVSEATRKR